MIARRYFWLRRRWGYKPIDAMHYACNPQAYFCLARALVVFEDVPF